jgi:lipopolysaccharide exporter
MSNPKYTYWLKSGIYSGLQKIAVLLFGIGSVLVLTRTLTKSDMGVWSLFLTITGIIEIVRQSLIKNAVIKYINGHASEEHPHIQSAALYLNIAITLLIGILIAAFALPLAKPLNAPQLPMVMFVFLPGLLLLIPFSHFEWVQNANADFRGIFWGYLARQGTSFILIVVQLLITGHISLFYMICYFDAGLLIGTFVGGSFAWKFLHKGLQLHKAWLGKLWHFGKFVFGTNIASSVFRNTDSFVISHFLNTSSVALYGVCTRISNLVDVPSQVLGDILFPRTAKMMEDGNLNMVKYYYEKAVGSILAIAVPASLVILLLPRLVISIIAGKGYLDAVPLLQVTIFYGLFLPFIKQFGTIMDSIGLPKVNFYVITTTAVCNIFICTFFTRELGLMGAAYGTMTSYGICLIITQTILYRKLGVSFPNVVKYMLQFYPEMLNVLQQRYLPKWKVR